MEPIRSLPQALDRLAVVKTAHPRDFESPASETDIETASAGVPGGIPNEWQSVARVSDGWEYAHNTYYTLIPNICDVPEMQVRCASPYIVAKYDAFASRFVIIGDSDCGDIYCLDRQRESGVGVTLISHESGRIDAEWPTIADFLLEVLSDEVYK